MSTVPIPNRGEIWLVDFDPAVGAEIRKARPAPVINLNSIGRLPLRLVVPITDWKSHHAQFPWFVLISADPVNGLSKNSGADVFQTKSVSLDRFVKMLGTISTTELDEVASAIALCVGVP